MAAVDIYEDDEPELLLCYNRKSYILLMDNQYSENSYENQCSGDVNYCKMKFKTPFYFYMIIMQAQYAEQYQETGILNEHLKRT